MKFLYWNINNQPSPFESVLKKVLSDRAFDVCILAENKSISDEVMVKDTDFVAVKLQVNNSVKKWVSVYYRKNDDYKITHHTEYIEEDDERHSVIHSRRQVNRIQVFKISGKVPDTYFACIHFPSKLYHDEVTHLQIIPNYKEKIHSLTQYSTRLFIVGDFNMNPFDLGMIEPMGFFAHNNRELVTTETRFKFGNDHVMYYNPCWTLLGDYVNKAKYETHKRRGGSFFFEEKQSRRLYWYLIDQIIMRKSLIDEFVSEDLEIIEDAEITEIFSSNANTIDHLPLQLSFKF